MKLLARHYDAAFIEKRYQCVPEELLLLAREKKLQIGLKPENYEILPLKNGLNPSASNVAKPSFHNGKLRIDFSSAYMGKIPHNDFVYLSAHNIDKIRERGYADVHNFDYDKDGYDSAIFLRNGKSEPIHVQLKDLFVPVEAMGIFDASVNSLKVPPRKRETNDKHECLREAFIQFYDKHGYQPTAKQLWKALMEQCEVCPPYPIERIDANHIHWSIAAKSMQFRTFENKLKDFR